ncbi:MAG TPA: lysylphosphatidylglycerol synthase transmembrane domain-containing protein [Solirubrobacteraceae bacterium]|nr:lysylphosphatidylglycerol synthase transmembrane domain-containing protein [Solirubrobacteraceae bacterium]
MAEPSQSDRVWPPAGPLADRGAPPPEGPDREVMPRVVVTRGRVIASLVFVVGLVVFLYLGLPKLVGFSASIRRLREGNAWWLAGAAILEFLSFCGYVALFRVVFVHRSSRIGWRESYQITMAGLAATRLFAAAGAGGIALTAWALRRSGMERRLVASRMIAFMALLYGVYMGALVVDGVGLYLGLWPGAAPFAITVIPAILGATVIALFLCISLLPRDFDRLMSARAAGRGLTGRVARRLATAPTAAATGVRTAIALVRGRDPGLLGAIAWWGFDIATLWACFHAFGYAPHKGVIVMAYFVGWIANTLPLPGGIGGVEGGLIGAFTAFGVSVQGAVVAVLAYRAFSFWLPTIPGAIAYFQLRYTVRAWEAGERGARPLVS